MAKYLERLSQIASPNAMLNLPLRAIFDGISVEVKEGSIESQEVRRIHTLIAAQKVQASGPKEVNPEKEFLLINGWCAKRIHNGVEENKIIRIYIENPGDPPHEQRKNWLKEDWCPRYKYSTHMLLHTVWRADYQFGFAEVEAHKKLRELIRPNEYERYLITGALIFEGKSSVHYVIRKSRPTLAFRTVPSKVEGEFTYHPLAAMCAHPAGYFERTWAGFLPPTDEVIAHLLLLRLGEHEFWKRCDQHPFDSIEAGI